MNKSDEQERAALQGLMTLLLQHTVVLIRTDEAPEGEGVRGSGFVIPWEGGIRIVTARHVIEKGHWAVEAGDPARGSDAPPLTEGELWNVPPAKRRTLLLRIQVDPRSLDAVGDDIAWANLDVDRDALANDPEARFASLPIYTGPLDATPKTGEVYAFAAVNRDEHHVDAKAMLREVSWEAYMTLSALQASEVVLALARKHQGHGYYRGASGAPIADRSGAIVGVLVGAGTQQNELRAASLERFISAMRRIESGR
ncbi:trypsin-like peptidase domain-containing protein [Corallococcus sp. EGB]|uniref:trypsin-like peptidase domain-containing protein n=1 Tax=Corallococcus sp. EGB TaxID=1521117 RepID=UPI001CBBFA05|nr:trypsin-like peptidase domain-containing protein [Corallococcus sp. EGB]